MCSQLMHPEVGCSPYLPHLWLSAPSRRVASGYRPPALTADCCSFPRICVDRKIKPILWRDRKGYPAGPRLWSIHFLSTCPLLDSRFSGAAGLTALVRPVADQPRVREGQASKNRLQRCLPVTFPKWFFQLFWRVFLFTNMLGTFKKLRDIQ